MPGGLLIPTIAGAIVIVVLVVVLMRKFGQDNIEALLKKRRDDAVMSQAGLYVEGRDRVPVAMTLTKDALYYENADIQARLDLERIDEVEYDSELSTSQSAVHGRVLRLRSHGQTFEFILEGGDWEEHLPRHRMDEPGRVEAV